MDSAAAQPVGIAALPPVIVDACGQLGDVVAGRIALYPGNLTEVVHRMAGVSRAPSHSEEEHAPAVFAHLYQMGNHLFDLLSVQKPRDGLHFIQKTLGVVRHAETAPLPFRSMDLAASCASLQERHGREKTRSFGQVPDAPA